MRSALLITALVAVVPLAGCFDAPGSTVETDDEPYTIMRHVRLDVDKDNIGRILEIADKPELIETYRYDFLDPKLVIRLGREVDPKDLTFTYTDRFGVTATKPLTLLTGASVLKPGDTITVDVHMFSGGVLKDLAGTVLADRTTQVPDWWLIGGYASGIHMAPGSELVFGLTGDARESLTLSRIDPIDENPHDEIDLENYVIDALRAKIAVLQDMELRLSYGETLETIEAESSHRARPLTLSLAGTMSLPMELSFTAQNTSSPTQIEGGIELLRATGIDFEATGKVWWNESLAPVLAELNSASMQGRIEAVGWLTGDAELEDKFPCGGQPRSAQCKLDDLPVEEFRKKHEADPHREPLDGWTAVVDRAIAADLATFLADDLQGGDLVSYRVSLRGSDLPGYEPNAGYPREFEVEVLTRVLGSERVTVGAGTFDTWKVDQTISTRLLTERTTAPDGTSFGALTIDETLIESSMWVDKANFVPVKATGRMPFDVGRTVDQLLDALDASVWEGAPIKRLTGSDVDLTVTSTSTMELTSMKGTTRFAPWMLVGGLPMFFLGQEGLPADLIAAAQAHDSSGMSAYDGYGDY